MKPTYWWNTQPEERFWVEIRFIDRLGTYLRCPLLDKTGKPNPWYDLVDDAQVGDIVYHWNSLQNGFVGKSVISGECDRSKGERFRTLRDFEPTERIVRLPDIRSRDLALRRICDNVRSTHPRFASYYLPFQFRSDGLRMVSNYFAKLPLSVVELLFRGGEERHDPESLIEITGASQSRMSYLQPFKPKSDADYVAAVAPRMEKRSRSHETLVNAFANWLESNGYHPSRNQAIDIGLSEPSVIFEAKTLGGGWAEAIRQAVGQLYEYRFFHVVAPSTGLIFLAPQPIPSHWQSFLEDDRGIGCAWLAHEAFQLSDLAKRILETEVDR